MRLLPLSAVGLVLCASSPWCQEEPAPDQGLTWSDLLDTHSTFRLYGFLRLDAMYDDSRMNDPQIPFAVQSEDSTPPSGAPSGSVQDPDNDELAFSARLTRLGFNFASNDPVPMFGQPKLGGKLEFDFYNIGLNDSDSRNAVRMRLAYLTLAWERWSLLAGQDWDVISPLYPAVNHDLMMWGAGNTGDRRPQLTLKNTLPLGPGNLISQFGFGFTGAVGGSVVDGGLSSGENSGRPMLHARVGYHGKTGSNGAYQLGIWAHDSEEEYDADGTGEASYDSNSVGLDAQAPLYHDKLWLMGEYWSGENLRDIRGGILQGVNPTTGETIDSDGGFLELGWKATGTCTLHAGYSYDDPEDADLDTFQRSENQVPYVAARWRFGDLRMGLEYLNWHTEYEGLEDGDAHRIVGWIAYYF